MGGKLRYFFPKGKPGEKASSRSRLRLNIKEDYSSEFIFGIDDQRINRIALAILTILCCFSMSV